MIKKLDKLIIKAFIGPFLATFLIAIFVLVMQFFWLYIDDLVGKGLGFFIVLKLAGFFAATAVPLALPLALLLSSIMTFGNLGESFELVAIKSSGIPLLRFMAPLLIISVLISLVAFLFSNNIIPVANLKLNALKYDIIVTKPALDIQEGIFYDKIEGFVIKVGKKEKDDSTIRSVAIYQKHPGLQDDFMVAERGTMKVTPDQRFLEFTLYNGWQYQENGNRFDPNTEFIRIGFKQYKKQFDLSGFGMTRTEDSLFRYDPKMLSVRQLNIAIDSLDVQQKAYAKRNSAQQNATLLFSEAEKSKWKKEPPLNDTTKTLHDLIPDSSYTAMFERSIGRLVTLKNTLSLNQNDLDNRKKNLIKHKIEWNRKFSLSVACIVLFMIGAPLGSIIRKGGLGTPLLFAIIFFVVFHLLNTFGEKFAKEGVTSVFTGMWFSTIILIPIGCFLTVKAMKDSQLFNQEYYYRFFRSIKRLFTKKQAEQPSETT